MKYSRIDSLLRGLSQGLVAYLILAWLAPQWQGNLLALLAITLLGAVINIIVTGLRQPPKWKARVLGVIAESLLLPPVVVLGGDSLHYGRLHFAGPLTLGFILLWAILLLPCSLSSMLLFSRRH